MSLLEISADHRFLIIIHDARPEAIGKAAVAILLFLGLVVLLLEVLIELGAHTPVRVHRLDAFALPVRQEVLLPSEWVAARPREYLDHIFLVL